MKRTLSLPVLYYLRLLAQLQIWKISLIQKLKGDKLTIIGVTASAGKTTTVKTIHSAIKPFYEVKINTKSSESGIPLNILNIQTQNYSLLDWFRIIILAPLKLVFFNWTPYQIYLTEMGIDSPYWPKNMSFLQTIIDPDIAIFLNVNPVHSYNFDKKVPSKITGKDRLNLILNCVATEKAKLVNSLKPGKLSIINRDDPYVKSSVDTSNQLQAISHTKADVQILNSTTDISGFKSNFVFNNQKHSIHVKNHIFPKSFSTSLATAILVANHLGIKPPQVVSSIEKNFENEPGRSSLLEGVKNTTIIDSSYNSSPQAVLEMLDLLTYFSGKKIAILGDMRELGLQSELSHTQLSNKAKRVVDLVVGVGPQTQKYFKKSNKAHAFQFWWQAQDFLKQKIKGGEVILVKGSQNTIFLEELVKSLLKNKSDSGKLCRQSKYWLSLKSKFMHQNSII